MNHSNGSAQLRREYAVYRYRKALERGDFDVLAAILSQAEHDAVLDEMIAALYGDSDTAALVDMNDSDERVKASSNGQSPKLNHFQEEKLMTTQIGYRQNRRPVSSRSSLVATMVLIAITAMIAASIVLTTTPSMPLVLAPVSQATPTVQSRDVITPENVDKLTQLFSIPKDGAALSLVSFSPDSRHIAYENNQKQIVLWNINAQKAEQSFAAPRMDAEGRLIVFSADGKQLAANGDGVISVWDLASGTERSITAPLVMWQLGTFSSRLTFSTDGKMLYRIMCGHSSDYEHCDRLDIYGWDIASGERSLYLQEATGDNPDAAFLAVTQQWVEGYADGQLILRDLSNGTTQKVLLYKGAAISRVVGSPDGSLVAMTDGSPSLQVFATSTGSMKMTSNLKDEAYAIRLMTFAPNNMLLATIGAPGDNHVQFWSVKDGQKRYALDASESNHVLSVGFSPDGTLMMTDSNDGKIIIWGVVADSKS